MVMNYVFSRCPKILASQEELDPLKVAFYSSEGIQREGMLLEVFRI